MVFEYYRRKYHIICDALESKFSPDYSKRQCVWKMQGRSDLCLKFLIIAASSYMIVFFLKICDPTEPGCAMKLLGVLVEVTVPHLKRNQQLWVVVFRVVNAKSLIIQSQIIIRKA